MRLVVEDLFASITLTDSEYHVTDQGRVKKAFEVIRNDLLDSCKVGAAILSKMKNLYFAAKQINESSLGEADWKTFQNAIIECEIMFEPKIALNSEE